MRQGDRSHVPLKAGRGTCPRGMIVEKGGDGNGLYRIGF